MHLPLLLCLLFFQSQPVYGAESSLSPSQAFEHLVSEATRLKGAIFRKSLPVSPSDKRRLMVLQANRTIRRELHRMRGVVDWSAQAGYDYEGARIALLSSFVTAGLIVGEDGESLEDTKNQRFVRPAVQLRYYDSALMSGHESFPLELFVKILYLLPVDYLKVAQLVCQFFYNHLNVYRLAVAMDVGVAVDAYPRSSWVLGRYIVDGHGHFGTWQWPARRTVLIRVFSANYNELASMLANSPIYSPLINDDDALLICNIVFSIDSTGKDLKSVNKRGLKKLLQIIRRQYNPPSHVLSQRMKMVFMGEHLAVGIRTILQTIFHQLQ